MHVLLFAQALDTNLINTHLNTYLIDDVLKNAPRALLSLDLPYFVSLYILSSRSMLTRMGAAS